MFLVLLYLTFFLIISPLNSIVLDRAQLEKWYPEYNQTNQIDLSSKEITSITLDAFDGLVNLQILTLDQNESNLKDKHFGR